LRIRPPRGNQVDVLSMNPDGGHIVVLGTAGSGKTMMAILRAQYLANPLTDHVGKTLLVTYNKALVNYLSAAARDELQNVDVLTFHQFAYAYLQKRGLEREIIKGKTVEEYIRAALAACGHKSISLRSGIDRKRLVRLLRNEFSVLCKAGITSAADFSASRLLSKNARLSPIFTPEQVFELFEAYVACRDKDEARFDFDDMLVAAYEERVRDSSAPEYRHIVIDEGQDFAPVMLRTLALSISKKGTLTFFGDVAQQIYGRETSWHDAGLNIDEPIYFKQNYRNTLEIAELGLAVSRMPYYARVADMVAPQSPADAGPKPTLVAFKTEDAELKFIANQARSAVETQPVAILCATTEQADRVRKALKEHKVGKVVKLNRDNSWFAKPRIYVGTSYAGKGLEFGAVLLPFCSAEHLPSDWLVELQGRDGADSQMGSLLYVGVTRARTRLVITYSGRPSHLLPTDQRLYQTVQR
jgi:superfamily I DNA/RNA helicase